MKKQVKKIKNQEIAPLVIHYSGNEISSYSLFLEKSTNLKTALASDSSTSLPKIKAALF